jgi:hypothetical protein
MKIRPAVLLAVLVLTTLRLAAAENPPETGAAFFTAVPGTNTLLTARDDVRAWRRHDHPDQPAVIALPRGEYVLTQPLTLTARDHDLTWVTSDATNTVITGGQRITGWAADASGVWHTKTDLQFEQFYVNGQRATRARFPTTGYFKIESVQQDSNPLTHKARLTVKVPTTNNLFIQARPDDLREAQILVFHCWDTSRYRISTVDPAARTLSVIGEQMPSSDPWNADSRFILDNCTGGRPLAPGTWILDRQGGLSYCPRPGEQLAHAEFVAPVVRDLLIVDGSHDVHFHNLRFLYARYDLSRDGCPPAQGASTIPAVIEVDDARNVSFRDCEVAHTGTYALWFLGGCHDCRVQHCLLHDLGAGGIRVGEIQERDNPREQTGGIVIDNNIIRQWGRVHPSAVGIWIGESANDRLTYNDLSDGFYTGISAGWTWGYGFSLATNNFIGFNRIHHLGQGALSDMGAIYTLGLSPGSAEVGNVIYDVRAHDYGGWGIYPDEGSSGWTIESNLVWNCTCVEPGGGGAFHQHYGATNRIANNIFALSSGPPMQATRVENHLSFILERNLIVSTNREFFSGPWDKIQFESQSNCFVLYGTPKPHQFPTGSLTQWQATGHDQGSILTSCRFLGTWPDVQLPPDAPAYSVGFKMFNTKTAGVYGDASWRRTALESDPEFNQAISPE